jgi:hypothetical protein
MKLFGNYIATRLKPIPFLILAILLSLLVFSPASESTDWIQGVVFLWLSFLAFRFLDDAGSIAIDRKLHPDRRYARVESYSTFLAIVAIVMLVYVAILYFTYWPSLNYILLFILCIVVLYSFFAKQEIAMLVLPLLKYPALLATLLLFPGNYIPELAASFCIVLIYDLSEELNLNNSRFWILIGLELVCGLLLFHSFPIVYTLLFVLGPVLVSLFFAYEKAGNTVLFGNKLRMSIAQFFHIELLLYYPIIYFVLTHLIQL